MSRQQGVGPIVRKALDLNANVGYETVASMCAKEGLTLGIATFRTLRSAWRSASGKGRAPSLPAEPIVVPSVVVRVPEVAPVAEVVSDLSSYDEYYTPKSVSVFSKTVDEEAMFVVPKRDPHFVMSEGVKKLLKTVEEDSQIKPQNVRLTGPAGCGKTSLAAEFAAMYNRPLIVMDSPLIREPKDWYGHKTVRKEGEETTIEWVDSTFSKFIRTERAVIVLDEINRVSPLVANALLPLLDHRRASFCQDANKLYSVAKGVVFFATTNEGREFTGTIAMDAANRDRLGTVVEVDYLPEEKETELLHNRTKLDVGTCLKLCQVASVVRKKVKADNADSFSHAISTRMLQNAAEKIVRGGLTTLNFTLLNHYSNAGGDKSERSALMQLLMGKFGDLNK